MGHIDTEQGPDFDWPQVEEAETNQVVTTIKNVVTAFMKNRTDLVGTVATTTKPTVVKVQETTMTSLINLVTGSATGNAAADGTTLSAILTGNTQNNNTILTEMAQNNNTILTEMAQNNSTVLTEMAHNNSTVLTEMAQSNSTVLNEMFQNNSTVLMETGQNNVTVLANNATVVTEGIMDAVVTTTETVVTSVTESVTSLVANHTEEADHFEGDFKDESEDKTLYIVVGTILAVFLLIVVILLVIYKKYKLGNLRSRSNAYCVNDLKQVRVSSGHDRKGVNC